MQNKIALSDYKEIEISSCTELDVDQALRRIIIKGIGSTSDSSLFSIEVNASDTHGNYYYTWRWNGSNIKTTNDYFNGFEYFFDPINLEVEIVVPSSHKLYAKLKCSKADNKAITVFIIF